MINLYSIKNENIDTVETTLMITSNLKNVLTFSTSSVVNTDTPVYDFLLPKVHTS